MAFSFRFDFSVQCQKQLFSLLIILPDLCEVEALRLESCLCCEAVWTSGNGVDHNPTKPTHSPLKI